MRIDHIASLDFETGSFVDLRKAGVARYAEDRTTRMICASAFVPGAGTMDADYLNPGGLLALADWIRSGKFVSAWNAVFELYIWNTVLPRQFPTVPWPKLEVSQLVDTMVVAAYWGLPLKLETAAEALPHLGIAKDMTGHRLMMQMNKPRDRKAGTWWHEDDPAKLDRLKVYCAGDVKTERAILADLPSPKGFKWGLPEKERDVWEMDMAVFQRGVVLDRDLVQEMHGIADAEQHRLHAKMNKITDWAVKKTTNAAALIKWVNEEMTRDNPKHKDVKSLAKDKLADMLERDDLPPQVRAALEVRQEAAKSSVAKLNAMENCVCQDGRMHGLTQYYGAFRSGRWAGRGPQVQNFPRSSVKDQEGLVRYILSCDGDPDGFDLFFGVTPLTGLSSALRGCLTVPKGKKFGAIDYSQIEARVTPWLAGFQKKLNLFRQGKDLYRVAAADMFGGRPEDVSGDDRQLGKVSELALAFGGGVGAFQSMAKVYGVKIADDEADRIKVQWREANEPIVEYWRKLEKAARDAIRHPGTKFWAGDHTCFVVWKNMLLLGLPSGRFLTFREPELHDPVEEWMGAEITYMDLDQYTRQWKRVKTYGGQLCNNATQGTARDVMAEALLRTHEAGHAVLASVHDEALYEMTGADEFADIERLFSKAPTWAVGLPIGADGYVSDRFRKG